VCSTSSRPCLFHCSFFTKKKVTVAGALPIHFPLLFKLQRKGPSASNKRIARQVSVSQVAVAIYCYPPMVNCCAAFSKDYSTFLCSKQHLITTVVTANHDHTTIMVISTKSNSYTATAMRNKHADEMSNEQPLRTLFSTLAVTASLQS
jgi:hypothetical protein